MSFSSNDYVGHDLGPDDPAVRDMADRTDVLLGKRVSEQTVQASWNVAAGASTSSSCFASS